MVSSPFNWRRLLLPLVAATLTAPAWAQDGALTVGRNLDQLVDRSAIILRGNVIRATFERHPELDQLNTVVVTMHVKQTLKGQVGRTFTFRQYVWDLRSRVGTGGYRKGQDLLLMMIAPSRYGLSSPAGMDQGRFQILRDGTGREIAVNGHGNRQLLEGVGAGLAKRGVALSQASQRLLETHRRGPIALAELTALIRDMSAGNP